MNKQDQATIVQPVFPPVLYIFFALLTLAIFLTSLLIPGPFIFGDEAVYFNLARRIALHGEFSGAQYNPLYPLLLSPFFFFSDPETTRIFTKAGNALAYASIAFPLYIISSRLFSERRAAILATAMASLMPAGAYTYVIWAEPIYYPLIAWVFAALLLFNEMPSWYRAAFLGLAVSLAFFAKQAGLLILPAIWMACLFEAHLSPSAGKSGWLRKQLLISFVAIIGPALWIIRNRINAQGGGGLGYQTGWSKFSERLSDAPAFLLDCIGNLLYSLSYYAIALYGILFLVFVFAMARPKMLSSSERLIMISAIVFSIGLALLSAVFFSAYGNGMEKYPNGRYFDAVTPVMLLVALSLVMRTGGSGLLPSKSLIVFSVILLIALVSLFSPLDALFAYSFVNNASFSYLQEIFGPGVRNIIWSPYVGSVSERYAIGIAFGILAVCVFFITKYRLRVLFFLLGFQMVATSLAYLNVLTIAQSGGPMATLFKGLNGIAVMDNAGFKRPLYFDSNLKNNVFHYYSMFWNGSEPTYIDNAAALVEEWAFDFGLLELHPPARVRKLPAPWRPEAVYDQASRRPGLLDIQAVQAGQCTPSGRQVMDWIFSDQPVTFRVDLPPGNYKLKMDAAAGACGISRTIAFDLDVSGQRVKHLGSDYNQTLQFVVEKGPIDLKFIPDKGALLLLDRLVIVRLDEVANLPANALVVTKFELPLGEVFRTGELKVYAAN